MKLKRCGVHGPVTLIKTGMGLALLATMAGCAGYAGGGYVDDGYGGGYGVAVAPAPVPPDVVLFGGDFGRGHEEREYGRRGYESRHGRRALRVQDRR